MTTNPKIMTIVTNSIYNNSELQFQIPQVSKINLMVLYIIFNYYNIQILNL